MYPILEKNVRLELFLFFTQILLDTTRNIVDDTASVLLGIGQSELVAFLTSSTYKTVSVITELVLEHRTY